MSEQSGNDLDFEGWVCPTPLRDTPTIVMGHGGGGAMSGELIEQLFLPAFGGAAHAELGDSAVLSVPGLTEGARLAFSTDSFVVKPMFFPGGSIGDLAVNGTVNDLAMSGATPLFLSTAFILSEGTPLADIGRVATAVGKAAEAAGVQLVTGDTKVVDSASGDGVYVNTAGIGVVPAGVEIGPRRAELGDAVIISGDIGVHGIAVMSCREGLEFGTTVESDTASLHGLVAEMLATGVDVHVLRDPTRGGVSATLNEIAKASGVGIELVERDLPIPHRGQRRLWAARARRTPGGQRGQAARDGPGRSRRRGAGGDARPSARHRRPRHRDVRRRAPTDGRGAHRARWHPRGRPARSANSCRGSAEVSRLGAVRFAQYAYPPNELGYCGPAGAEAMLAPDAFEDIERRARLFDGAWSYLELLAAAAGIDDPLDVAVVDAYWVGSDLLDTVDSAALVLALEERFRGQFGGTWREASARAAAHHSFQVFEVYPWAGLLREGRPPEPAVNVLDRCRIRVGEVTAVEGEQVTVSTQLLVWDGAALEGTGPVSETARWSVDGSSLIDPPAVGDTVALHWDWVCAVIGPEQARMIRDREALARAGAGLSGVRR